MTTISHDFDVESIDIYTPEAYAGGAPHEVFAYLRREHPVFWQETPEGWGFWAVCRHADLVHVAKHPLLYSASLGGVVYEDLAPEQLEMMRDMVLAMDPPRHTAWRRNLAPHFKAKVMAGLEPRIREIVRGILAEAAEVGELDFAHDVCAKVPTQVVGELVGIPEEDRPQLHRWSEQNSGGQDPDIAAYAAEEASTATINMAMYAIGLAGQRREDPHDDLITLMLAAEVDGEPMTDLQFGSFFVQIVTAGNDTSRTMLSSGLWALLQHPQQLAALRADRSLIPGAVEEILRWANPLHYFRRTASADTELEGQQIRAGDKVAMMYTSANRDDAVFADPMAFDITRDPNPHLSFGIAEHFCLGVHLARLEGRVFFEELLDAFDSIEQIGDATWQRSNLNNSLKTLPVRLSR